MMHLKALVADLPQSVLALQACRETSLSPTNHNVRPAAIGTAVTPGRRLHFRGVQQAKFCKSTD